MKAWKVKKVRTSYGSNLLAMPKGSIPIAVKEIPEPLRYRLDDEGRAVPANTFEVTYLLPVKD